MCKDAKLSCRGNSSAKFAQKGVSFFVSFLENALRFPISFVVSIVRSAPVGKDASGFGWLK
jgi:hypothetical protein